MSVPLYTSFGVFNLAPQILFLFWPQKASVLDSKDEELQLSFESEYRIMQQQGSLT